MAFVDIFTHSTKLTLFRAEAELRGTNPKRLEVKNEALAQEFLREADKMGVICRLYLD